MNALDAIDALYATTDTVGSLNALDVLYPTIDTLYTPEIEDVKYVLDTKEVLFFFRFNDANFDDSFKTNSVAIAKLDSMFDNPDLCFAIDTLRIVATASPEGKYDYNIDLAKARSLSFRDMLIDRYPLLNSTTIALSSHVSDWSVLRELIKTDFDVPWWGLAMAVLEEDRDYGTIGWKLRQVGDGETWQYIKDKYLSTIYNRDLSVQIVSNNQQSMFDAESTQSGVSEISICDNSILEDDTITVIDSALNDELINSWLESKVSEDVVIVPVPVVVAEDIVPVAEVVVPVVVAEVVVPVVEKVVPVVRVKDIAPVAEVKTFNSYKTKDLFALKTNLLFDVATLVNVEIEVPIGRKLSFAGEFMFPWWKNDNGQANSKRSRLEILSLNIEGRYWFGNRDNREKLTGWFAGVHFSGGTYDFEKNTEGTQGDFFLMGGLTGGYAHTINKSGTLRMEYSIGIGYMMTDFKKYKSSYGTDDMWHPLYLKSGSFSFFGPTRAKVSLVWMLNTKTKRGGVR